MTISTAEMTIRDYWRKLGRLVADYQSPAADAPAPIDCVGGSSNQPMEPMRVYRGRNWVVCRYREDADEQVVFNMVAAALPPDRDMHAGPGHPASVEWILLPPAPCVEDPLGQHGYLGAKWQSA